jgi:hypothetical protein
MMSLSLMSLNQASNVRWTPRHRGLLTLISGQIENDENFAFRYEIELDFFHGYIIRYLTIENLNWQKWTPRDFSKNHLS